MQRAAKLRLPERSAEAPFRARRAPPHIAPRPHLVRSGPQHRRRQRCASGRRGRLEPRGPRRRVHREGLAKDQG